MKMPCHAANIPHCVAAWTMGAHVWTLNRSVQLPDICLTDTASMELGLLHNKARPQHLQFGKRCDPATRA